MVVCVIQIESQLIDLIVSWRHISHVVFYYMVILMNEAISLIVITSTVHQGATQRSVAAPQW